MHAQITIDPLDSGDVGQRKKDTRLLNRENQVFGKEADEGALKMTTGNRGATA